MEEGGGRGEKKGGREGGEEDFPLELTGLSLSSLKFFFFFLFFICLAAVRES